MDSLDWNFARAFCATAEAGSLSSAARKLGLTQPTLSRQVQALEDDLGVALFERVGKRLVLTEAGTGLREHALAMAAAADAMALAAAGQSAEVEGRVTVSAIDVYWAHVLPDVVMRLRSVAPQVTLCALATDEISDLRRREADIAIRHVRPSEPDLIAQLAGETSAHFYASEAWVATNGLPRDLQDLSGADLLTIEPAERFLAHLASIGLAVNERQCRIVSSNSVALWAMACRGVGVCMMLPEVGDHTPGMVRLLPDMPGPEVPVWLVSHRELRTSRRVRLVFDVLLEEMQRILRPACG
jgi:DNA-binding transcriptional LysR family regulator